MFILHILDDYETVTGTCTCDTLEDAMKAIKHELKEGAGLERLELLKKIDFDVTFEVTVKAD